MKCKMEEKVNLEKLCVTRKFLEQANFENIQVYHVFHLYVVS